ncbi:MAG: DsbA family oxidoreductase, partial [Ktedonobacteraceae bacterium]|nr:DsbA family oxidoreductase [Ktedonobacteraceae bacterium]
MKVEIWSDVACPWCYLGKRRFEEALAQFEHRDQVEVTWRSYQLDPSAPQTSDATVNQVLAKKHGMSAEQVKATTSHISELGTEVGIDYHFEQAQYGNTFDAHRLIHLAAHHGLQNAAKERFLKAYFSEGVAIGDHDTLVKLISEVGIDPEEARAVLNSDEYAEEVRADIRRARMFGVNGVPFFAIEEKYGISGAQPTEVFSEVLEKVWGEEHP